MLTHCVRLCENNESVACKAMADVLSVQGSAELSYETRKYNHVRCTENYNKITHVSQSFMFVLTPNVVRTEHDFMSRSNMQTTHERRQTDLKSSKSRVLFTNV